MSGVGVRLAGAFDVSGPLDSGERVGRGKARLLLALLAAYRGRLVACDRIAEVLWGQRLPRRPEREVATLVSRLRAALGREVVLGGPAGYRLGDPPAVRVDLDDASRLIDECRARLAAGDAPLAAAAGRQACAVLGSGPALADMPDAEWVHDVRAEHAALLRTARHVAADAALHAGDVVVAVELAEAAAHADPLDESAHRLLMAALQAAGEPARALAAYQRLRAELAEQLGVDPAPETRAVYQALLTEAQPPVAPLPALPPAVGLAGRSAEVARLTGAWSRAVAGRPSLVVVAGEGGIGKTRLAAELVAAVEATGGRVLSTRCYASERSLFLQPLVDALGPALSALPAARVRELAGSRAAALAALLPELVDALGPPSVERISAELAVRGTFEAVTAVLRELAAERPTLLLLDDLHNAGLATVELLHYMARRTVPARLLLLATLRGEEGEAALNALTDLADRLDLGPLPAEAVIRLAEEAGQAEHAATILRRTRGHPLFVVETLRGLAAGEFRPPETLRAAVLARLHRLGTAVEEALRAGAVLGPAIDTEVVAGMLHLPPYEVARRCGQAVDARLLVEAERDYEFANDVVQEVLYATTPAPIRTAHHRRAADLSTGHPEVVGRHASAAGDWTRAAGAFLLAGDQALTRFAAADAEVLLTRALEAAERVDAPELVCRALLGRGRARDVRGDARAALGDFQAGLVTARRAGDRRHEMRALREVGGHATAALGFPIGDCVDRMHAGLSIAGSLGDRQAEADFLARLAILETNRLRFAAAVDLGRRAVAVGRAARSDQALALGLDGMKNPYAYLGESRKLGEVLDELLPLLRRLGDLERLQWAVFESAVPAIAAADWPTAQRRVAEAAEIAHRSGMVGHEQWFVAHLGWLARLQGRLDDAVRYGRAAVMLARGVTQAWFGPAAAALLAGALLELGDSVAAAELLTEALRDAGPDGAEVYRLRCLAPLAEATGDADALVKADALLAAVQAPPQGAFLMGADAYLAVARSWLRRGDPARARAVLDPLLVAARRLHFVPVLVTAGLLDVQAAGALGEPSDAALARITALGVRHGMPVAART